LQSLKNCSAIVHVILLSFRKQRYNWGFTVYDIQGSNHVMTYKVMTYIQVYDLQGYDIQGSNVVKLNDVKLKDVKLNDV